VIDTINSTRDGGLHDYNYDGLDQLTSATRPAGYGVANESYLYDKVGNREVPTDLTIYQYDNNHRITQSPGLLQYTYDLAGNQLTRTDGVTMTYDTDNRLTTYVKGATSASYAYDAFGRRIKKTVNGVITYFAWDGSQLIAEYSSTGVRQKRYAYLPNSLNPVQVQDVNGTYNVHSDHLDTARFLTNSAQVIVWSAKQSAFGQTTVNQDVDGNGTAVVYNLRFPGQYFDAESNLHQNYFRDYDPSIGRYIESDPIGLEGGINTYAYVSGNPLSFVDPKGQTWWNAALFVGGTSWAAYQGYKAGQEYAKARCKTNQKFDARADDPNYTPRQDVAYGAEQISNGVQAYGPIGLKAGIGVGLAGIGGNVWGAGAAFAGAMAAFEFGKNSVVCKCDEK